MDFALVRRFVSADVNPDLETSVEDGYIAFAIPVFGVLIAAEWWFGMRTGKRLYRLIDSLKDLSCGVLQRFAVVLRQSALQPFQSMVFYWPLAYLATVLDGHSTITAVPLVPRRIS